MKIFFCILASVAFLMGTVPTQSATPRESTFQTKQEVYDAYARYRHKRTRHSKRVRHHDSRAVHTPAINIPVAVRLPPLEGKIIPYTTFDISEMLKPMEDIITFPQPLDKFRLPPEVVRIDVLPQTPDMRSWYAFAFAVLIILSAGMVGELRKVTTCHQGVSAGVAPIWKLPGLGYNLVSRRWRQLRSLT